MVVTTTISQKSRKALTDQPKVTSSIRQCHLDYFPCWLEKLTGSRGPSGHGHDERARAPGIVEQDFKSLGSLCIMCAPIQDLSVLPWSAGLIHTVQHSPLDQLEVP